MPAALDDLGRVLTQIAGRADCRILPPTGQVTVGDGLGVPPDLRWFHDRCGGVILFLGAKFPWHVAVPERVTAASPRLLTPGMASKVTVDDPDDLTNGCLIVADGGRESSTDASVVVDLHPDRLGRYYLAFWDTYGVVGEMPIVALNMTQLLEVLLGQGGRAATLPGLYGDAYEPLLPWESEPIVELDVEWLTRWREAMTELVASVMPTFEATMGYPPGDNRVAGPITAGRLAIIEEMGKALPSDLVTFSRVVGEVRLPDIGNGWFVLNPLFRSRIGCPYNVDVVLFASDGGGTTYAVPIGKNGPVLRVREVAEIAPGVYDGERVEVSAPHLQAFLTGLRDAVGLFARNGGIADL